MRIVYLLIDTLLSCFHACFTIAVFSSWGSLARLETVVNNECWLVDIQMSRSG